MEYHSIPVTEPTPLLSSAGGVMLAISTVSMLVFNGKLLGLSGIAEGLLFYDRGDFKWKAAFTASFMATAQLVAKTWPSLLDQLNLGSPWYIMTVGGFLVGYGTRLGNGCTSGHGICGLARLSSRSIAAVVTFLTSALATARTLGGMPGVHTTAGLWDHPSAPAFYMASAGLTALFVLAVFGPGKVFKPLRMLCTAIVAALFSSGLCLAGMGKRAKILNLLIIRREGWDYSLLFVLGIAVAICFVAFRLTLRYLDRPLLCHLRMELEQTNQVVEEDNDIEKNTVGLSPSSSIPKPMTKARPPASSSAAAAAAAAPVVATTGGGGAPAAAADDDCTFSLPGRNTAPLDLPLVLGAWLFGVGWGLCGICPGPAIILVAAGYPKVSLMYLPALYVGMAAARATKTLLVPKVFAAPKEDEQRQQQQAPAAAAAAAEANGVAAVAAAASPPGGEKYAARRHNALGGGGAGGGGGATTAVPTPESPSRAVSLRKTPPPCKSRTSSAASS